MYIEVFCEDVLFVEVLALLGVAMEGVDGRFLRSAQAARIALSSPEGLVTE